MSVAVPVTSVLRSWHSFRWMFTLAECSGYMKGIILSQICSNLMVLLKTAGCVCCFLSCLNFCTAAGSFVFDKHHELKLKNTQTWDEYLIMETWTCSSLGEIMCKTHSFWFFYLSDNLKPIEEGTSCSHPQKNEEKNLTEIHKFSLVLFKMLCVSTS